MSLFVAVKKMQLDARKARNTLESSILTTLLGAVMAKAKDELREVTDLDIQTTSRKFLESVELTEKVAGVSETTTVEKRVLTSLLPTQMTVSEIKDIVSKLGITTVKEAQLYMRANHSGKYNGKDVNEALK